MWTDGRMDGQTDKTKLIVAFRNFANAPKTTILRILYYSDIYLNQMIQQNKYHIHIFIVFPDDGSKNAVETFCLTGIWNDVQAEYMRRFNITSSW
jgi:hypothetical protein